MTKAKVYTGAGQEGSMRVTLHTFENVGECEGMNLHTPLILGIGVLMDFQIFRKIFQGSKFIGLKSSLYHWKYFET